MKAIVEIIFWLIIVAVCLMVGHTELNSTAPYIHVKHTFRAVSLLLYIIFMYVMTTKYGK